MTDEPATPPGHHDPPPGVASNHWTSRAWTAAGVYLALALFVTWPLTRRLGRDVPGRLGDPLLSMWALAWDCEQLAAIFRGDLASVAKWFDANIFHPAPLALAYSEHLIPQALQILPVYLATRNPILCYNLLYLSTYVLSGVGAYLLVRELTGDQRSAFLGGLLFAFAPYRILQVSHLEVLSAQWMPFALFGFARYFTTRSRRALAGATAAVVLQGLSAGHYLLYFTPFAAAYVLWELGRRHLWSDWRVWKDLAVIAMVVATITTPFLLPYARVQDDLRATGTSAAISSLSADVYSYFTAVEAQNIWGTVMRAYPTTEGQLFPGAIPLLLGLLSVSTWLWRAWRDGTRAARPGGIIATIAGILALTCVGLASLTIFERRLDVDLGFVAVRVSGLARILIWIVASAAVLLAVSPRARARLRALATIEGFFIVSVAVAWWLSLGPSPQAFGRTLELPALYALVFDLAPSLASLHVPARYGMILVFMLSVAGAVGVAPFLRRRGGAVILAALTVAFVVEAHATTFLLNDIGESLGRTPPEARVYRPEVAPAIYHRAAELDVAVVLLELPIGDANWDVRSVYYSTVHWHRVVNGYSSHRPPGYSLLALALADPSRDPTLSRQTLEAYGVTHVIVHEHAFGQSEGDGIREWLLGSGARQLAREGTDVLYEMGH